MTVVWVVLLFAAVAWAYVMLARHLNTPTPPTTPAKCQHEQTMAIGKWARECSGCGEVFEVEPS